ncbi:MAG: hypothetical protein Q4F11_07105, partial [Eubacteriales bacterium]|nr:hypothetical protein [Eubacteriales bacterium]
MLKLTKYEFRKNPVNTVIVLLILLAAQLYFTASCILENLNHAAIAMVLLVFLASISFIVVIVFGINAYSKELNSNSSYLIFMTPNSPLKILLSKLLYTFLFGCMLAVILFTLSYADFKMISSITAAPLIYIDFIK